MDDTTQYSTSMYDRTIYLTFIYDGSLYLTSMYYIIPLFNPVYYMTSYLTDVSECIILDLYVIDLMFMCK